MSQSTVLSQHVGVQLSGRRGADLVTASAAEECLSELAKHGVVVYPALDISDDDLVAFSRLLGQVAPNPTAEHRLPEIATITLDPSKTRAMLAWFRQGNFQWHIDGATEQTPQKATLLTARKVDPSGGDTEFASTYAAYEALSAEQKAKIADLRVVHSFATAQRLAHPEATETEQAEWARVPDRVHPLVWAHQDGRKSLVLGATAAEIVDWPAEDSTELLNELLAWCTQPQFVLRHHWQVGDLVIWDNTGMLHRALPFEPSSPRLMHRTTLVGEEPIQ